MEFRNLRENEIDVRIGQVSERGGYVNLLLYKDARVDMNILDETVGATRWQRKHYELNGVIYCSVGIIFPELGEWVWKDDCGSEGNIEKDKAASSDSFKRACTSWGIGRELYTSPEIKISCEFVGTEKRYPVLRDFKVEKIRIDRKIITGLAITAYNTQKKARERVFLWTEENKNETV